MEEHLILFNVFKFGLFKRADGNEEPKETSLVI